MPSIIEEPIDPEFRAVAVDDHSPEAAFVRSAGYVFGDQPLKPFSAMRFAAAQRLGLRFGNLADDEVESAPNGMYSGMLADAIMVVFLCAASESTVMKAFRAPDTVLAQAMAWAEANGVTYGSERMLELCQVFGEIMADLMTSSARPSKTGRDEYEGAAPGN